METKTKTLNLPEWIIESVSDLARQQKRSFTKQVEAMLEDALIRRKDVEDGKTQIDPAIVGVCSGE